LRLLLSTLPLLLTTLPLLLTTLRLLLPSLPLLLPRPSLLLSSLPLLLSALSLLLARLAAQWILSAPRQRLDLVAEPFDVVQRSGLLTLTLRRFAWALPLLRLVHLLVQLIETFADAVFRSIRVGVDSAAEPVGCSLYTVGQISLVHAAQCVA
jgi:hypothetical protein